MTDSQSQFPLQDLIFLISFQRFNINCLTFIANQKFILHLATHLSIIKSAHIIIISLYNSNYFTFCYKFQVDLIDNIHHIKQPLIKAVFITVHDKS